MSKRIGILTGGGDCPGLNAVIRAVVLHARNTFGWETVGIRNGFEGLYEEDYVDLDPARVAPLLARGGTMLGSSNRANPFAYPLKLPDGRSEIHDVSARCLANLAKLDLGGLIVVGGDGTMSFGQKFIERGANRIVGVPKTIDNDLEATEMTIGFATAVEVVVEALERLHTTAESHDRVMVVEVMGRHSGWIATYAGIAGGATAILIPEEPFDIEAVCELLRNRHDRGRYASIVVVAEGAEPKEGSMRSRDKVYDQFGHVRLGGVAETIANAIEDRTGFETRMVLLGHIQRGGTPTAFDRVLSTRYGVAAIDAVHNQAWGHMVVLRGDAVTTAPLSETVGRTRPVDMHLYHEVAEVFFG